MADKVIIPEDLGPIIEKWMPVIEGKGKWEAVVEGAPAITGSKAIENMALNLEILEQTELKEGTMTGDLATYKPVMIPMVRRIMPSLISSDIFGVQPMTGPTGMIFSLRSTFQGNVDEDLKRANSVIVILADASAASIGDSIAATADDSVADPVETAVGTIRHKEGNNLLVEVTSGEFIVGQEVQFAAAVSQDGGQTTIAAVYENETLQDIIFTNYSGRYDTAVGETLGKATKEVGFEIDSDEVKAETRKLKARWSRETEDDLRAVHGLNAENLLTGIATDEITMEMNREFIDIANTLAVQGGVTAWNYADADGRWELEKYQNLCATISRVRRQVAIANKRGQANFMIVSPAVLSALEATGRLSTIDTDPFVSSFVGTFQGMKVFVDIFATSNYIILGYKGREEVDAGVFFAPYIPLRISKGYGEEDDIPRLFFSTRYGIGYNPFGGKNYFRKITIANLPL